jgi:hypothetical protein
VQQMQQVQSAKQNLKIIIMSNQQLIKQLDNIRTQINSSLIDTELKGTYLLFCQLIIDEVKLPEVSTAMFTVLNNEKISK